MKKIVLIVLVCSASSAFGVQEQTVEQKQKIEALEKRIKTLEKKNENLIGTLNAVLPRRVLMTMAPHVLVVLVHRCLSSDFSYAQSLRVTGIGILSGYIVGEFYDEVSGARKKEKLVCLNNKTIEELIAQKALLEVPLN